MRHPHCEYSFLKPKASRNDKALPVYYFVEIWISLKMSVHHWITRSTPLPKPIKIFWSFKYLL